MILLIDNYDSFSYNLYQLIGTMDSGIQVIRNDELTVGQIGELNVSRIILSPGPGRPSDAGVCIGVVKEFAGKIPILGVCLGHQTSALSAFRLSLRLCHPDQFIKPVCLPCGPSHKKSVDRGLYDQFFRIPRIDTSAIKYRDLLTGIPEKL